MRLVHKVLYGMLDRSELLFIKHRLAERLPPLNTLIRRRVGRRYGNDSVIDIQHAIYNLYFVSRETYHTFDKILVLVFRIFENDDLAALRFHPTKDPAVRKWYPRTINELVYEQMVTDRKRGDHGSRRDLESLHDKLPDEQGDDRRDQKRLYQFFVY